MAEKLSLPQTHPIRSLLEYMKVLGPLIFPLHRAALLRKRILFVGTPPLRRLCDFGAFHLGLAYAQALLTLKYSVYILSVISGIPSSVIDELPIESDSSHRLRPLFTVGVNDIPLLEEEAKLNRATRDETERPTESSRGWVACTTDGILTTKTKLYDVIVEIPASASLATKAQWPTIKDAHGLEMKATQRDLRRYISLRSEMSNIISDESQSVTEPEEEDDETARLLPLETRVMNHKDDDQQDGEALYADAMVERVTWPALAYSSFMWWASAGERDTLLREEAQRDSELFGDPSMMMLAGSNDTTPANESTVESMDVRKQISVIEYFHRLTALMLSTAGALVESSASTEGLSDNNEDNNMIVESEKMGLMGLDEWSHADRVFLQDLIRVYYNVEAEVHAPGIECCGIKIS